MSLRVCIILVFALVSVPLYKHPRPHPVPFPLLLLPAIFVLVLLNQRPFATATGLPDRVESRSAQVSISLMERRLWMDFFALEFA